MTKSNSQSIKIQNTNLLIGKLMELQETSRIELARLTTLNKATVSSIIADLLDKNLVIETAKTVKTSGRSANVIALNKEAGSILSLELQPTQILSAITNLYGEILYELYTPITDQNFVVYLKEIVQTIDTLKANTPKTVYGIIGIGIGVYGIVDIDKKIKYTPYNNWKNIDLKKIIEDYTGIETYVENEANISALGENISFPSQRNIVSITIGIGVGMGIIINNKLYVGSDGFAGEIGHTIVHPQGRQCVCGNKGCLETYIKNSAIIDQYEHASSEIITIEEFTNRYKRKDPYAMKIYSEFIEYVSLTINNVSQLLNPKAIVINSVIIENISESISLLKNNLNSNLMNLDILTLSKFKSKTNILGVANVLIKDFLYLSTETN